MGESLEDFLKEVLENFVPDNLISEFMKPNAMIHWKIAFIHPSVNMKHNYEKFELFGDKALEYGFYRYLREIRGMTNSEMTSNLKAYYLSENYQPVIARKIGLDQHIKVGRGVVLKDKILEDVSEAFFGVFAMIGRRFWLADPSKYENPITYTMRFFDWYFEEKAELSLDKAMRASKTFLVQYHYFMANISTQGKPKIDYNPKNNSLILNPMFLKRLSWYNESTAEAIRQILRMKLPEDRVYSKIQEILMENGFNPEWLNDENRRTEFKDLVPLAKANDLTRFKLLRNEKESYDLLAQGVDPVTRSSISTLLYSFDGSLSLDEIRVKSREIIVEKYGSL